MEKRAGTLKELGNGQQKAAVLRYGETVFQSRINRNAGFWEVLKQKNLPYKGKGMKKVRKFIKRVAAAALAAAVAAGLTGCGSVTSGKRIIRVSHAQSETHPEHIGLLAFKEYVEERLGDKYEVQIFPNEILGSAQKAIELTQTGAIDFVVAGTANLETFAGVYEIFSMPYLFDSEDVYKSVMQDTDYMEKVYESTDEAGFRVVTWYNAGVRNFYAKTPIHTPDDLKGKEDKGSAEPGQRGHGQCLRRQRQPPWDSVRCIRLSSRALSTVRRTTSWPLPTTSTARLPSIMPITSIRWCRICWLPT